MQILDGKAVANQIQNELQKEILALKSQGYRPPKLTAILVGEDHASQTYVKNKMIACKKVGIESETISLPQDYPSKDLIRLIEELNQDIKTDGILVQMPLPNHISPRLVIDAINPEKDVDGFTPLNMGKLLLNLPTIAPATPFGVIELLRHYSIDLTSKRCVVIGRSQTVGMPLSVMLAQNKQGRNATVTICHSKTIELKNITLQADILIVAIGKPEFIDSSYIKEDAIVVDVGIHSLPSQRSKARSHLVGDVNFDSVAQKAAYLSPVPGGVGPMTVTMLLCNTLNCFKTRNNIITQIQ